MVVGLTVITRHRYELHPQHVAKNDFRYTQQGNKVTLLISIVNDLLNLTINVPTYKVVYRYVKSIDKHSKMG